MYGIIIGEKEEARVADHMRRNDKLQALAADAARANARTGQDSRTTRAAHASSLDRSSRTTRTAPDEPQPPKPGKTSLGGFVKQNATYILSVVAVVALVVLMIVFIRACAPHEEATQQEPGTYTSPYDWTKLDRTDNRYAYVVNGQVKSRLGIDVSENQHDIDWPSVAEDGIDFAMIRLGYRGATEGDLYLDTCYWGNLVSAHEVGIDCGIYFFSQATNTAEAIEEAEFVLDNLKGEPLEYPIAFDSEVVASLGIARTAELSPDEMTAIADAFCKRIEQAGYRTLVYGNSGDLSRYNDEVVNDGGVWWAEYGSPQPNHYLDIVMWQYSNSGVVAGVSTNVDMNIDLSGVLN